VVHHHRTLGDRVQRKLGARDSRAFQRLVPERKGIEVFRQPLAIHRRRRLGPLVQAEARKTEFLQRLRIHLHDHRNGRRAEERVLFRELEVILVRELVIAHVLRPSIGKERLVLDIFFPLLRIRRAAQVRFAVGASPAGEKTDAGQLFVVDDEVPVVAEFARPVGAGKCRELEPRGELDQHLLPRPHVAVELEHRMTDGIACRVRLGNRTVEKRDRVVALEIRGVGQDEIGEVDGLGMEGVDHYQEWNRIFAALVLAHQHLAHLGGVHGRVPGHVGHEQEQCVDRVRVPICRIGDDHVHQAVGR